MADKNDPYLEMLPAQGAAREQYQDFRNDCPQFDPGEDYLVVIDDDSSNIMEIVGAFGRDNFDPGDETYQGVMAYALNLLDNYPNTPYSKFNVGVMQDGKSCSWILPD